MFHLLIIIVGNYCASFVDCGVPKSSKEITINRQNFDLVRRLLMVALEAGGLESPDAVPTHIRNTASIFFDHYTIRYIKPTTRENCTIAFGKLPIFSRVSVENHSCKKFPQVSEPPVSDNQEGSSGESERKADGISEKEKHASRRTVKHKFGQYTSTEGSRKPMSFNVKWPVMKSNIRSGSEVHTLHRNKTSEASLSEENSSEENSSEEAADTLKKGLRPPIPAEAADSHTLVSVEKAVKKPERPRSLSTFDMSVGDRGTSRSVTMAIQEEPARILSKIGTVEAGEVPGHPPHATLGAIRTTKENEPSPALSNPTKTRLNKHNTNASVPARILSKIGTVEAGEVPGHPPHATLGVIRTTKENEPSPTLSNPTKTKLNKQNTSASVPARILSKIGTVEAGKVPEHPPHSTLDVFRTTKENKPSPTLSNHTKTNLNKLNTNATVLATDLKRPENTHRFLINCVVKVLGNAQRNPEFFEAVGAHKGVELSMRIRALPKGNFAIATERGVQKGGKGTELSRGMRLGHALTGDTGDKNIVTEDKITKVKITKALKEPGPIHKLFKIGIPKSVQVIKPYPSLKQADQLTIKSDLSKASVQKAIISPVSPSILVITKVPKPTKNSGLPYTLPKTGFSTALKKNGAKYKLATGVAKPFKDAGPSHKLLSTSGVGDTMVPTPQPYIPKSDIAKAINVAGAAQKSESATTLAKPVLDPPKIDLPSAIVPKALHENRNIRTVAINDVENPRKTTQELSSQTEAGSSTEASRDPESMKILPKRGTTEAKKEGAFVVAGSGNGARSRNKKKMKNKKMYKIKNYNSKNLLEKRHERAAVTPASSHILRRTRGTNSVKEAEHTRTLPETGISTAAKKN